MAKRKKEKRPTRGVTLVEVLVVVAILSTAYLLAKVGVSLLNNLMQTSAASRIQQEAQLVLYSITKEVRNCYRIVHASSGTLQLQVFNTKAGFNLETNPGIFNPVNVGTLTYTYVNTGSETYLRKTIEYPGTATNERRLLKNLLLRPDTTNYMFNVCDSVFFVDLQSSSCPIAGNIGYPDEPYEAVDIRFKMSPSYIKNSDVEYSVKEMRRSGSL